MYQYGVDVQNDNSIELDHNKGEVNLYVLHRFIIFEKTKNSPKQWNREPQFLYTLRIHAVVASSTPTWILFDILNLKMLMGTATQEFSFYALALLKRHVPYSKNESVKKKYFEECKRLCSFIMQNKILLEIPL